VLFFDLNKTLASPLLTIQMCSRKEVRHDSYGAKTAQIMI